MDIDMVHVLPPAPSSGMQRRRRHSILQEDLDQANDKRLYYIVYICEWIGLTALLSAWVYIQVACLTAKGDMVVIIGIPFRIGPNFQRYLTQQAMLLNIFGVLNTVMMLSAKFSSLAFAI